MSSRRDYSDYLRDMIHGYFLVDVEIVWKTVKEDLPPLVETLEKIVSDPAAGQE